MCKLAFFMTTKNSEKSTCTRLRYFLPFGGKIGNTFFSQNCIEICPLGNVHMLKNISAIRFEVRLFVTAIWPRHHLRAFFSKSSK